MAISTSKPLITFALMAYNCEPFIKDAIAGAFSQTYRPLEIIFSDDCSTDHTFEIMKQSAGAYKGSHRIVLNRNNRNIGISGHINRIMELCSGEIVVIAAADDISLPNRVEKICEAYLKSQGKAMSIHSSCILIDETGAETGRAQEFDKYEVSLESVFDNGTWLFGCTHAWHRSVFDKFGPLPPAIKFEDEVIPFRSLLLGKISYIREPLVRYRLHGSNASLEQKRLPQSKSEHAQFLTYKYDERLKELKSFWHDLETAANLVDNERRENLRRMLLKEINRLELEVIIRKGRLKEKLNLFARGLVCKVETPSKIKLLARIMMPGIHKTYCFYKYQQRLKQTR